jgi:hypothetical protein
MKAVNFQVLSTVEFHVPFNVLHGKTNKVLGYHALVFEELDKSSSLFKQSFKLWRSRCKEKTVQTLDQSSRDIKKAVHIVYPSKFQIYFAKNLDCTPHYTITNEIELAALIHRAQEQHLTIHEYLPHKNYSDVSHFLAVINFDSQQDKQAAKIYLNLKNYFEIINFSQICSQNLHTICPKRKIRSASRGFMAVAGSKWTIPYPFLSEYTPNRKLCKPGICGKLSEPLKSLSAEVLCHLGQLMICLYEIFMPVYHDFRRGYDCAYMLHKDLLADSLEDDKPAGKTFVFEGCTVIQTCLNDHLEIHVDTLNYHSTEGYNITAVVCLCTKDEIYDGQFLRTSVIRYSRQA